MEVDPPQPAATGLPSDLVTLNISSTSPQHTIVTARSTLRTSPYFNNLLSRWEDGTETLPNGAIFIDAEPEIFKHVLDYMRRPTVFPLFWTREKGFDHVLYAKVMAEADFFMLEDLRDWIRGREYMKAVSVEYVTRTKRVLEFFPPNMRGVEVHDRRVLEQYEDGELVHCFETNVTVDHLVMKVLVYVYRIVKVNMSVCYKS
ncbi:hypothetical protein P280DRAFT_116575 [Massarina eburnea CBS 473.64]|uniref:Potassium channel tetramerisation-type BTB domain-containing protein n=1 Tax=Massarina eburnea CBS 473.64 TaxID=1395130 RepID=A0A6A6SBV5_9PLEO|nr:hypothetical protein P280DRAFT_116575 [Massarina eburnea CBS 473.64]